MLIDVPQDKSYALLTGGPTVFVTSRSPEGRDSTKNILASGEFGISVPGTSLRKGLVASGSIHAREITEDKFAYAKLDKLSARVIKAPLVKGALAHLECRIVDHDLFARTGIAIADVVSAQVEADYWDGESIICEGRPEQTLHSASAGTYFPRGHVQSWYLP